MIVTTLFRPIRMKALGAKSAPAGEAAASPTRKPRRNEPTAAVARNSRRETRLTTSGPLSHADGRLLDRGPDALVRPTPADVAAHRRVDVGVRRALARGEQRGRAHYLARLAVSALRHVLLDPSLLHGMEPAAPRQALDGRDPTAFHRRDRCHAGAHRGAVHVHGASTAEGHAAAELRAGKIEIFAQHPEERLVLIAGHVHRSPVHVECRHLMLLWARPGTAQMLRERFRHRWQVYHCLRGTLLFGLLCSSSGWTS